ncbi:MAG TPA: hypothetical protein VHE13_18240 [Opitutus sp.]|nr:hypothetical protein [Opitutus sp.]
MLPFLKKKGETAGPPALPAWHPNFRNEERLPDTKVVRTAFFVNGGGILTVIILLAWFGYQEFELRDLRSQIQDWQARIARDQRPSDQAIALFKKYQTEAARFNEIDAFVKSSPPVSRLLLQIAQTLPRNVALDLFDLGTTGLRLIGTVRGAPDQASGYASAYLDQLRADPVLAESFDEIELVNLKRNDNTGRLTVEFFLHLKGAAKRKP